MNKRKQLVSILAGVMAAVLLLSMIAGLLPTQADAASSSEIRKQINSMKEQQKEIQGQIKDIKAQYQENGSQILSTKRVLSTRKSACCAWRFS